MDFYIFALFYLVVYASVNVDKRETYANIVQ